MRPDRRPATRQHGTTGPGPDPRARPRPGVLRLTPDRIREAEFPRSPLGHRGIDEEEVRRFLSEIAEEVATRDAADAAARATIDHYKRALARWQAERNDELTGASDTGTPAEAVDVLTRAQHEADAYVAEAKEYGQQLVEDARARAQTILDEARSWTQRATPVQVITPRQPVTPTQQPIIHAPGPTPVRSSARGHAQAPTRAPDTTLGRSHLLWTRTFLASLRNVETQIRTAREALSSEFARFDRTTPQDVPTA